MWATSIANMSTGVTTKHPQTVRAWSHGHWTTTLDCCITQRKQPVSPLTNGTSAPTRTWPLPGQQTVKQMCSRKVPAVKTSALITPPRLKVYARFVPKSNTTCARYTTAGGWQRHMKSTNMPAITTSGLSMMLWRLYLVQSDILSAMWRTALGHYSLKLWEPGYDIFTLWNRPKTSSCQFPYHAMAPLPIALESCSRAQTDQPVF